MATPEDRTLHYPVWVRQGSMLVRRDALDPTHPESLYNWIKDQGEVPEDYGVYTSQMEPEQHKLIATVPIEALYGEIARREKAAEMEAMYGDA